MVAVQGVYVVRALCPRCARAVHKVCTIPHPNYIVVPSINNNEPREYRVRSPSPPPSPGQPGRSLLASLEAKQRDTPPPRRSNPSSMLVSQPRTASRLARSPYTSTASSPSLPVHKKHHIRGRHWGWDIHAHGADCLHTQHQNLGRKEGALRRLRHTPVRTKRSAPLLFDRFARLWHWKIIRDIWMGSAHDCGSASSIGLCNIGGV